MTKAEMAGVIAIRESTGKQEVEMTGFLMLMAPK